MGIDELMIRFRLASRELFNNFFRIEQPYENHKNDGWDFAENFEIVERVLFQKLVSEQVKLPLARYGEVQSRIGVVLRRAEFAPIMLNREIHSGYWDHPVTTVQCDAMLNFVCFFDWDQLELRDNRYVRVIITDWPTHPEAVGKHGLIDSQHVRFKLLNEQK